MRQRGGSSIRSAGRARRKAVAIAAALTLAGVGLAAVAPTAGASVATFPVMNTSESMPDGVWFRNSPRQNDTNRETGFGVYAGESMAVDCFSWADPVGQYNNHIWYRGLDVSRPTVNGHSNYGWMNTHYVNDGMTVDRAARGVPDCNASAPSSTVALSQGPAAPAGYRYALSLSGFAANAAVSITCYDSVSPGGFYTFSLTTNGSGAASTASYCYSGDGPDHWVVAGGVASNRVAWGGGAPGGGTPGGGSAGGGGSGGTGSGNIKSVFYSPNNKQKQAGSAARYTLDDFKSPIADRDLAFDSWKSPNKDCFGGHAFSTDAVPAGVGTISGWSIGRVGPMYFLAGADDARQFALKTIVLYDPGTLASMEDSDSCDWRFAPSINFLINKWLTQSSDHHLIVYTGFVTEEHQHHLPKATYGWGKSRYSGLWKHYFAGIWGTDQSKQALVCDYNNMDHQSVLRNFAKYSKTPKFSCPSAPSGFTLTKWQP